MLPLSFLHPSHSGMEFIEWQNQNFFNELSQYLSDNICPSGILSATVFSKDSELRKIIKKHTGFENMIIHGIDHGNLAVDSGYIAPHAILNNAGLDNWYSHTETTLYRWFKRNGEKAFKGSIDYTTGKVKGGFSTLPFTIYINVNLYDFFDYKLIKKYDIDLGGALAGVLVHEIGHMFTGCMLMYNSIKDNLLLKTGLRFYKEAKTKEERITVIKDTQKLLEVDDKDFDEIASTDKDDAYILYYSKLLSRRNKSRALSLGVPEMTSEVLADMYSIRMGCHEGIMNALSVLLSRGSLVIYIANLILSSMSVFTLLVSVGVATSTALGFALIAYGLLGIIGYFSQGFSWIYNADHRRLGDGMRQLIAKLKEDKTMDRNAKKDVLKQLEFLEERLEEITPWYENTIVRRVVGRVLQGGDFKYSEIEHYTGTLQNHEVNLLGYRLDKSKV